jgi:hypothetical protein
MQPGALLPKSVTYYVTRIDPRYPCLSTVRLPHGSAFRVSARAALSESAARAGGSLRPAGSSNALRRLRVSLSPARLGKSDEDVRVERTMKGSLLRCTGALRR